MIHVQIYSHTSVNLYLRLISLAASDSAVTHQWTAYAMCEEYRGSCLLVPVGLDQPFEDWINTPNRFYQHLLTANQYHCSACPRGPR
jgi:hypothetical protein